MMWAPSRKCSIHFALSHETFGPTLFHCWVNCRSNAIGQCPVHLFIDLFVMFISSGCRVGLFGQTVPLKPRGLFKPCTLFCEDPGWVRTLSCCCTREWNAEASCNIHVEVGTFKDIGVMGLRDESVRKINPQCQRQRRQRSSVTWFE